MVLELGFDGNTNSNSNTIRGSSPERVAPKKVKAPMLECLINKNIKIREDLLQKR